MQGDDTAHDEEGYDEEGYDDQGYEEGQDAHEDDALADAVAIIGMAGRFPGANSLEDLWQNLAAGVESTTFFSDEELRAAGVDEATLATPGYVRASPILDDVEHFDAGFFDFSPREAEILDPQHRIFLEVAWEALERAGYTTEDEDWVGVFAGSSASTYLLRNLFTRTDVMAAVGGFQAYLGNDRDYFTTRTSYKLDLRGPSLNVQTACSTSLVAIHLACQSLLDYQCRLALAGGIRVWLPQRSGYVYQPGGIVSPDGHCRAFDARAGGSIFGNGAGVVVLKRLADALADGDTIDAVIRGSALNNDGSGKVGYTAPSVEGQVEAITMAQGAAGVEAATVTYVETHGSGTPLGDPIEVEALTEAFRAGGDTRQGACAIGSVKSNFGHLESAAGVAGMIKTVLALKHRQIPPSLGCERPNPQIDFATSPFFVNTALRDWENGTAPRRAGVSSFGIGGTNAHIVVEEAPPAAPADDGRPWELLVLAARTASALETATDQLAAHLQAHPEQALADVAFTLQTGRRSFEHRRMLMARESGEAAEALAGRDPRRLLSAVHTGSGRAVTFLFPGLGDHYPGLSRALYRHEAVFREEVDRCATLLQPELGVDLRGVLYPPEKEGDKASAGGKLDLRRMLGRGKAGDGEEDAAARQLHRTLHAQPALFVVSYALARLWMSWGVTPQAMLGYSLGEYVAACLAEVLTLEDALRLVAARARWIEALPAGAMLAVPQAAEALAPQLGDGVEVAAVNGPEMTVVAGPAAAVDALAARLRSDDPTLTCRRLPTTHAFHTQQLASVTEPLTELLQELSLQPPRIPYISNVSGDWISAEEATDPAYWARHLCQPVRFADGLTTLWQDPQRVFVELGPGRGLGSLALQHGDCPAEPAVLSSLPAAYERRDEVDTLLDALGQAWLAGVRPAWRQTHGGRRRRRLPLPTYPFERRRFWIEPAVLSGTASAAPSPSPADAPQPEAPAPPAASLSLHARPNLRNPYVAPAGALEEQVAAVWRQVLGIEEVGAADSFFDLGGHSLLAPRLMIQVSEAVGLELPLPVLFAAPTVGGLAARIEQARREGVATLSEEEEAPVDLGAEIVLDEAIRVAGTPGRLDEAPRAIFLSGATGFVGAFLLAELLAQSAATIHCLARADDDDEARQRILDNLARHQLPAPPAARLVALAGDLAAPRFGLAEEAFAALAAAVDVIYHAGAWVNFTYPYSVLAPANVHGTHEALRLAAAAGGRPLHFISSMAVFPSGSYSLAAPAREDDPLANTQGLFSGYAESKWVAEKLVRLGAERGIPVTVHRPGVVSGHSATGVGNPRDMVWNILKGCLQLGAAFTGPMVLDVTPVDYVARATVHLARRPASEGLAFHYPNPRPMAWNEVFAVVGEMGYELEILPAAAWLERLLAVSRQAAADNALIPFLPLLPISRPGEATAAAAAEAPAAEEAAEPVARSRYDGRHTAAGLSGTDVRCPPIDPPLIRAYVEHFVASGFLPPPARS